MSRPRGVRCGPRPEMIIGCRADDEAIRSRKAATLKLRTPSRKHRCESKAERCRNMCMQQDLDGPSRNRFELARKETHCRQSHRRSAYDGSTDDRHTTSYGTDVYGGCGGELLMPSSSHSSSDDELPPSSAHVLVLETACVHWPSSSSSSSDRSGTPMANSSSSSMSVRLGQASSALQYAKSQHCKWVRIAIR